MQEEERRRRIEERAPNHNYPEVRPGIGYEATRLMQEEERRRRIEEKYPIDKIKIINGPNRFYYYTIDLGDGNYKKILLFGENHEKLVECKKQNNCIDFTELLYLITNRNKKKCIDFFIEENPKKNESWNINELKGGTGHLFDNAVIITKDETMKYMLPKLRHNNNKLKLKNNVRIQKIDLRNSKAHQILVLNDKLYDYMTNYKLLELDKYLWEEKFNLENRNITRKEFISLSPKKQKIHISNQAAAYDEYLKKINYKKNIKKILNFLIIDINPTKDVLNMINIMVLELFFHSDIMSNNLSELIIIINNKISEITKELNIWKLKDYIKFLELIINIILKINSDEEFLEINRILIKQKQTDDQYAEKQVLIFHPSTWSLEKKRNGIISHFLLQLNPLFLDDIFKVYPKKELILLEFIINIFNKIYNGDNFDNFINALKKEILFYKEIIYMKNKINKAYEFKFLNFCNEYPHIFGDGTTIREQIINIMINKELFDVYFELGFFLYSERHIRGLESTLSDVYTFFRMFTLFDQKDRGPFECRSINTPLNIISYSGGAHCKIIKLLLDKCINEKFIKLEIESKKINFDKVNNINLNNLKKNNIGNLKKIIKKFIGNV